MDFPLSYYEGFRDEVNRMSFIEGRDGIDGALDFANRTISQYQNAMRSRKGAASDRSRLPRFRGSVRYMKFYVRSHS